jgi:hypothetical protein
MALGAVGNAQAAFGGRLGKGRCRQQECCSANQQMTCGILQKSGYSLHYCLPWGKPQPLARIMNTWRPDRRQVNLKSNIYAHFNVFLRYAIKAK